MTWAQVQSSEQSSSLCWKNVSREKLLEYAITKQVKKLLLYLHRCGDDKIVVAILQVLSSCTWYFASILFFSNLITLFSEIYSIMLYVVHTMNAVVTHAHIDIYVAAAYFQLFVGSSLCYFSF